LVISQSLFRIV